MKDKKTISIMAGFIYEIAKDRPVIVYKKLEDYGFNRRNCTPDKCTKIDCRGCIIEFFRKKVEKG